MKHKTFQELEETVMTAVYAHLINLRRAAGSVYHALGTRLCHTLQTGLQRSCQLSHVSPPTQCK